MRRLSLLLVILLILIEVSPALADNLQPYNPPAPYNTYPTYYFASGLQGFNYAYNSIVQDHNFTYKEVEGIAVYYGSGSRNLPRGRMQEIGQFNILRNIIPEEAFDGLPSMGASPDCGEVGQLLQVNLGDSRGWFPILIVDCENPEVRNHAATGDQSFPSGHYGDAAWMQCYDSYGREGHYDDLSPLLQQRYNGSPRGVSIPCVPMAIEVDVLTAQQTACDTNSCRWGFVGGDGVRHHVRVRHATTNLTPASALNVTPFPPTPQPCGEGLVCGQVPLAVDFNGFGNAFPLLIGVLAILIFTGNKGSKLKRFDREK